MVAPRGAAEGPGGHPPATGEARAGAAVTLVVDGRTVRARKGAYLLEAARQSGATIPTLCHHEAVEPWGGCRLCVVDVSRPGQEGGPTMVVSCLYPVEEGLVVQTDTERVRATRREILDLLLARCPETPLIQRLAGEYGIVETSHRRSPEPTDCILCGLCVRVCDRLGLSAISAVSRGIEREVAAPFRQPPEACVGCLACARVCPTGHIRFESADDARTIWGKRFAVQRCPTCGRGHITIAQADLWAARSGMPRSYFEACDRCKRAALAETIARVSLTV